MKQQSRGVLPPSELIIMTGQFDYSVKVRDCLRPRGQVDRLQRDSATFVASIYQDLERRRKLATETGEGISFQF